MKTRNTSAVLKREEQGEDLDQVLFSVPAMEQ